jgi:hypothetical protein
MERTKELVGICQELNRAEWVPHDLCTDSSMPLSWAVDRQMGFSAGQLERRGFCGPNAPRNGRKGGFCRPGQTTRIKLMTITLGGSRLPRCQTWASMLKYGPRVGVQS